MADFYTYRNEVEGQRHRRLMVVLVLVLALVCAVVSWMWFRKGNKDGKTAAPEATPMATLTPLPQPSEAPVGEPPQRILAQVDTAAWNSSVPVDRTIDTEFFNTDYRMAALPMQGTVARSYFNTVTFVGDSLTSGLGIYDSGYKNAHFAAYISAGPNSFVNNVQMNNAVTKVNETPMEAIVATQPDYVYIMLGTNSLVQQGNEEGFIAYYERMIDMLREQLNPGVAFYIQAIPAVQEWVVESKPGLDNARITIVNNLIANMALRKGCYFVNPCEVLNSPDGSQVDEYEVKDGVHLQPSGYRAWAEYLATHTAWNRRSVYTGENPYYIFGA